MAYCIATLISSKEGDYRPLFWNKTGRIVLPTLSLFGEAIDAGKGWNSALMTVYPNTEEATADRDREGLRLGVVVPVDARLHDFVVKRRDTGEYLFHPSAPNLQRETPKTLEWTSADPSRFNSELLAEVAASDSAVNPAELLLETRVSRAWLDQYVPRIASTINSRIEDSMNLEALGTLQQNLAEADSARVAAAFAPSREVKVAGP